MATEDWPEHDPYPKASKASEAELREVAESLVTYGPLISGQRFTTVSSPSLSQFFQKHLEEQGALEEVDRYSKWRERKIVLLMEWYGDAVRRTQGADPQDLVALVEFDFIRDPE